ncbi:MAG: hypothetical protein WCI22_01890 [Actinomycetota bacterium]
MNCTTHAQHVAPVAIASRPCGLGFGYQWRNVGMSPAMATAMAANATDTAKKRSTRRLGQAAT